MVKPLLRSFCDFAFLITCFLMAAAHAPAEGFRIATRIYVGDDETLVSEATTLFLDGAVYDFLSEPEQIAVFRKPTGGKPGRFILLDPARSVQTEFTTEQLAGAIEGLTKFATQQSDPAAQHAANPQFKESFHPESGRLILASYVENYSVATQPAEHPEAMPDYIEFLDWYARLNTLLRADAMPPGPRLKLNAALARHKAVPLSVELKRSGSKEPLRAKHDFTWRLSRDDMGRIEDVRTAMAGFRKVSNEEFLRRAEPTSRPR
jgi:hypothetical protein